MGGTVFLVLAGAVAALVGSAGGITSLVSYPALLAVGLNPLAANVTNAVALVASGLGSTAGSRPELRGQGATLRLLALPSVLGGLAGAGLLLVTPVSVFGLLVPFLIALASVLLLVPPRAGGARPGHRAVAPLGMFAVSVYGGYFGAGGGVLTLVLLLLLVDADLPRANAFKNVVLMLADVVVAVVFVVAAPVSWAATVPLAVGALVGGRFGPALTRRVPARVVRPVVAATGFGLAGWLLFQALR